MLELLNMLMCMGSPKPPPPPPPPKPAPPPPSPPAPIATISTPATVASKTGGKNVGTTKTKMARRAQGKSRFRRDLNNVTAPTGLNIG